jgi:hypothetical protein
MNENYLKQFRKSPDYKLLEKIHVRLERKERIWTIRKYSALSILALIFAFGILMTFSSTVRAEVLQTIEEIAGLRFDVTNNYPGNPDEEEIIVPGEYLSLEEAQSRFAFPIMLPAYIPQGYERLVDIEILGFGDMPVLFIRWQNNESHAFFYLTIDHCPADSENCGRVVGEGALEEIMLNEKPAVLVRGGWNYDTKQYELNPYDVAVVELIWRYDDHNVYALGADEPTISLPELIKIAESIP